MEESRVRGANPEPSPGLRLSFTKEEKEKEMMNGQGHELSIDKRLVLERWLSR